MMLAALVTGLLLGIRHSVEPDHIAAVSTLIARTKSAGSAMMLGISWAIGHTAVLLAVGLMLPVFGLQIPESMTPWFEGFVAVLLVVMGMTAIVKHAHSHTHGKTHHRHAHSFTHHHKSFLLGVFHGLAGSGAVLLLLLATADSFAQRFAYIGLFALGTAIGMLAVSRIIAIPAAAYGRRLTYAVGGASVLIGCIMLYSILA